MQRYKSFFGGIGGKFASGLPSKANKKYFKTKQGDRMTNNKVHVIFTKGLISSGKSTWAEQFIKENPTYKRTNRDSYRHMISGYTYTDENEKIVTKLEDNAIQTFIDLGYNIIIDQQNLNQSIVDKTKAWIEDYAYHKHNKQVEFEIKEFPITLGEAIERDKKRSFVIGEKVIKKTWHKYEIELKQMIERAKPKYEWNDSLPYCVLCDIDGTLSHSPNRRIFDFKEVINDSIHFPVWSILDKYRDKVTIILMSGREEICRTETEEWLKKENVNYQALYMRKEKDYRSDTIVKRELFDEYIRGKYQPMFVVDDRPSVVQMWIDMGLFVFNVNQDPWAKNPF